MKIRKFGLFLSVVLLVACPFLIGLWGYYVCSYYPPKRFDDPDNAWAVYVVERFILFDFICAVCAVLCARGWEWRVAFVILGLLSLAVCLFTGFWAAMFIVNAG